MTLLPSVPRRLVLLGGLAALAGCAGGVAETSEDEPMNAPARSGLTPPLGRLITVNGRQVHVWEEGRGPTVILLHGASGNLRDFTFGIAPDLVRNHRVVAFDRPGLGHSAALHDRGESPAEQAAHLDAAAAMAGVARAVVVGHSFGASVAMAWALNHPARVAAVVSLAGAVNPWPGGLGSWYSIASSRLGGATIVPLVAALAPRARAEDAVSGIFTPDPVPEGYIRYVGVDLTLRAPVLRANARQVNGLKPHVTEMAARYPRLTIPVEIVHGTADTIVPAAIHSEPLARTVPAARLTLLPGVGHMPHHARPAETIAAIGRAVRRAGLG